MVISTGARLAALYTGVFAVAVLLLGATTLYATRATLRAQFEDRVRAEALALLDDDLKEGVAIVQRAVRGLDQTPGELRYGLQGPGGASLGGRLGTSAAPLGWSTSGPISRDRDDRVRVYVSPLPDGYRLLIGYETERWEVLDEVLLRHFGLAFALVLFMGVAGGYLLSRDMRRRLGAMNGAAEAIIDGDLSQRIPICGARDDLDQLASTLNRMLDRIGALMESLRQVSNDIAHDLRTPLTRLRQRLEAALDTPFPEDRTAVLDGAMSDLDAILVTFAALLRIAQIDSGSRRAGFRPTNLAALAQTVVEAFSPSAEEVGQSLTLGTQNDAVIEGDAELVTQMLVNLVENAMRHAGPSAAIVVGVEGREGQATLSVQDDGPGVPSAERPRLFDRFYRLERSRSTPGSGLGLALVASIARLHGAEVRLDDAAPGLRVSVRFAGASPAA